MVELSALWLPILLTTVVMFFASFLCWMILPHHKGDWTVLPGEAGFLNALSGMNIPEGNYRFPYACDSQSMGSEEYKQKLQHGPVGTLQIFKFTGGMGKQLGMQFIFFLLANTGLAYLSTLSLEMGDGIKEVFHFVSIAAFLIYTVGTVPGSIWFRLRLRGYLIDGVIQALIAGTIFGWLWPTGPTL